MDDRRAPCRARRGWIVVTAIAVAVLSSLVSPATAADAGDEGAPPRGPDAEGVRSSPYSDRDRNRVYDDMDEELNGRPDDHQVTANLVFTHPVSEADLQELRERYGGFEVKRRWTVVDGFSGRLTKGQVQAIARRDDIVQIEKDREVRATISTARRWYGVIKAAADFGVDGDGNGATKSFTTADVVACVIDTGIDDGHVDLDQGQVIAWRDFVLGQTSPYDDNGHGSHVAGILAGQGDGDSAFRGVARGAALVGVKVLDASGSGTMSDVISAVDFCVQNKTTYNIRIINMSLGDDGSSDGTDSLSIAVNNAFAAGILPVVAAGNEGPGTFTIGSPGAAENALTVCSLADPGEQGFFLSPFSSRGPTADGRTKPDLCGPGHTITSVLANTVTGYATFSGTSMSTPFVTGVAALMLDANSALTPTALNDILMDTAQDWRTVGADIDTGAGRLQAYNAIEAAGGFSGSGPSVPEHYAVTESLGSTGKVDRWQFFVSSSTYPAAMTLIVPSAGSTRDFDLYLDSFNGSSWVQVAQSEGITRQETVTYTPTRGSYRVRVESFKGSGTYHLDFSYRGGAPSLKVDG